MENQVTTPAPGAAPAARPVPAAAPATTPAQVITPPVLADVAAWLADEIAETHAAIMGVHKFAAVDKDVQLQLNCMKTATRMMQAQAVAAMSLQRLTGGKGTTVTIVHEKRNTPPPKKSRTNRRQPQRGGVEELWEDEEGVLWNAPPGTPGRRPAYEEDGVD